MPPIDRARLLSTAQAAELLAVHPNTISNWRSNRRVAIPFIRLGRAIRYREDDLREFLDEHRVPAGGSER